MWGQPPSAVPASAARMWLQRFVSGARLQSCRRDRREQEEAIMPGGVQTEVRTYQMFINGEWVDSKSAKIFPVYDPSTEEVIAQVPDATSDDVNRAVSAAKAAFEEGPWATTTA